MSLDAILEQFLIEGALAKGSQRVMNDKNMSAQLADSIADDVRAHPQNFPADVKEIVKKARSEEAIEKAVPILTQWFLENIDAIEREGYEGTVYSRDGINSEWIARRYIAGSHNWEDLTGVMNMNFRDYYLLKNRNMLDPAHKDIPKFNSVRDIGTYMSTHYKADLDKVRDAAKNAARNKMSKSIKLVDNDDYRIYTTLNRAAGCLLGLGTQWCTANSNYAGHFNTYSSKAMLFQLFPYTKEKDEEGKKVLADNEKYQFDAGTPAFMNITDSPAKAEIIREKFPYLYSDLVKALKDKKPDMEKAFSELSIDPTLQGEDYKIKTYEIDDEIKKLEKFVSKGYFTEEPRPRKVSTGDEQSAQGQPEVITPTLPQPGREQTMENVDKDIAAMMANLKKYDKLTESVAPVLMSRVDELSQGKLKDYKDAARDDGRMGMIKGDQEKMDKRSAGMKQADKRLKEEDSEEGNPWEKLAGDKKDSDKKEGDSHKTEKGGTVTKTDKGVVHKKADESVEVNEDADQEVLAWMGRFAKLGNMKGYGR